MRTDGDIRAVIVGRRGPPSAVDSLLNKHRDIVIVARCGSTRAAGEALPKLTPDLLFLPMELRGAERLASTERLFVFGLPIVIATTGNQMAALRIIQNGAVTYLIKPLDDQVFGILMTRARALIRVQHLLEGPESLVVHVQGRATSVRVVDITWIEEADGSVRVHEARGWYQAQETLQELERRLDPKRFVRVHRTAIVNADRVSSVRAATGGRCMLVMDNGTCVRTSLPRASIGEALRRML